MADKPKIITTNRARGGVTGTVRYVLMASLALAIAAMVWVFLLSPKGTQEGATTSADPISADTPSETAPATPQ
ncbi:hypothetical protein [Polymorphobacter fuscus]|uniref:Uncharacterized protein n=1 Tax=Sandarakinorhabdus fusca TaxID=1439888 RepID=A0A7C9GXX2_9SPHN|nr:hypothetical protein [Polymorphobacter fuscus]KAB7646399.1 hypothetical protein F9290_10210 [Polymorphobacter fuscus]MQT17634.1 hypothetical protein [Polymorphobacter fuscus]NJC09822.1 hypothetical protein [Polymorphobacter fuscus]